VIVGASDQREIVRARDRQHLRPIALQRTDPLRRAVGELDRDETRDSRELRLRDRVQLPRNCEDEQRWIRRVHRGVVPLALRVRWDVERNVQHVDVLRSITRLERRQEQRRVAAVRGIRPQPLDRARDALVIGDVRDLESRRGVPRAVARDRQEAVPVPRMVRVTVEVDREVICVGEPQRRHRPWDDGAERVHQHPDEEEQRAERDFVARRRGMSPRAQHAPRDDEHDQRHEQRDVLLQGEERERVEGRHDGRQDDVRQRAHECRVRCRTPRQCVHDGRCRDDRGEDDQCREEQRGNEHGASIGAHAR